MLEHMAHAEDAERRKARVLVDGELSTEVKEHIRKEDHRLASWHIGREIPVAVVTLLVLQTCGVIWWAATQQANVAENRKEIAALAAAQRKTDEKQDLEGRLTEQRILVQLNKLEVKLDQLMIARGIPSR